MAVRLLGPESLASHHDVMVSGAEDYGSFTRARASHFDGAATAIPAPATACEGSARQPRPRCLVVPRRRRALPALRPSGTCPRQPTPLHTSLEKFGFVICLLTWPSGAPCNEKPRSGAVCC
jgi:hypothetical protein